MKLLVVLGVWLGSISVKAAVLLVPEPQSSFAAYAEACRAPGRLCTYDYFTDLIRRAATPAFDAYIDSVDLSSQAFRESSEKNLRLILKKEMLNETQLEQLLALTRQLPPNPLAGILLKMRELLKKNENTPGDQNFIFAFKKKLSLRLLPQLRALPFDVPYYILRFDSVPAKNAGQSGEPLLNARGKLNVPLTQTAWRPFAAVMPDAAETEKSRFTKEFFR